MSIQKALNKCLFFSNSKDVAIFDAIDVNFQKMSDKIAVLKENTEIRRVYNRISSVLYTPNTVEIKNISLKKLLNDKLKPIKVDNIQSISAQYYYLLFKFIINDYFQTDKLKAPTKKIVGAITI